MNKFLLLIVLSLSILNATDNVWSKDTPVLSEEKSLKILQAYEDKDSSKLEFDDDITKKSTTYNLTENIFNIGFSVGSIPLSEELSNQTGTNKYSHDSYNIKFTISKDYTFWHKEYTQPTRLYFNYSFTRLEDELDFTSWAIGIRENMFYWSFYENNTYKIYPTISFEIGKSSFKRDSYNISGRNMQADLGITLAYGNNFEYFINFCGTYIEWEYPIDGIKDTMSGYGGNIGLNYKFTYEDF